MRKIILISALVFVSKIVFTQGFGIVRKNYFSTVFDSTLNMSYEVLDSFSIRLGTIDNLTGNISNLGPELFNRGINLTGATINPYLNKYIISSGSQLLTFDLTSGELTNSVQIQGEFATYAFQNYRFNPSDSTIYGLVPNNYYSTYFDSIAMMEIEVLDSSQIRFAKINPTSGEYEIIGNQSYKNLYTLAGNSIDPHQMLYYYSAFDTLVGIDLYNGNVFSEIPIQLPQNAIFENFTYSCADTSIYGIARQNFISQYFDSLIGFYTEIVDSTTFKLCKIEPNSGIVTIISPSNLGIGGSLNGSCYIDPSTMTYYFSSGNNVVGISLATGLITSSIPKTFQDGAMYFDMMRSKENCMDAISVRLNGSLGVQKQEDISKNTIEVYPNPTFDEVTIKSAMALNKIELLDLSGKNLNCFYENSFSIQNYPSGVYLVKMYMTDGSVYTSKLIKKQ